MRKKFIAGNWKMNMSYQDSEQLVNRIGLNLNEHDYEKADVLVCPPFTSLSIVNEVLNNSEMMLGAQNLFYENDGAYTGEISASMLQSVGCKYVIVGHSERRQYFHETNEIVNRKVKKAFEFRLIPILCVGESLEERENGEHKIIVKEQVIACLENVGGDDIDHVIIAYEPVWAIGTGKTASPAEAEEMHLHIRETLSELYGEEHSKKVRILYGGSVKESNSEELLSQANIDGALIGGASLKPESFTEIIKSIK